MKKSKVYLSLAVVALSVGVYGCAPYATRNSGYVNPGTGEIYNENSFSRYNDSNYYSNNVINGTTRDGMVYNATDNMVLNNTAINRTTSNMIINGTNVFTNDIVGKYSLTNSNVANIKRGMSYDQVVAALGVEPYFTNSGDAAAANNRKNKIGYYFVNGRTLKVSFINGKVDKVSY